MRPTCCKQFLLKRQGHLSSDCLIWYLETSNDWLLFMALGTKDHILGAK